MQNSSSSQQLLQLLPKSNSFSFLSLCGIQPDIHEHQMYLKNQQTKIKKISIKNLLSKKNTNHLKQANCYTKIQNKITSQFSQTVNCNRIYNNFITPLIHNQSGLPQNQRKLTSINNSVSQKAKDNHKIYQEQAKLHLAKNEPANQRGMQINKINSHSHLTQKQSAKPQVPQIKQHGRICKKQTATFNQFASFGPKNMDIFEKISNANNRQEKKSAKEQNPQENDNLIQNTNKLLKKRLSKTYSQLQIERQLKQNKRLQSKQQYKKHRCYESLFKAIKRTMTLKDEGEISESQSEVQQNYESLMKKFNPGKSNQENMIQEVIVSLEKQFAHI